MDRNKTLLYAFVAVVGLAVTFFLIKGGFSGTMTAFLLFTLVFLPTLINPNIGLVILIISIIYSPEVLAGQTAARYVTVRAEDILLMVIIFAWFIKTSFTKDIAATFETRITGPFFLYIGACILSTLFAAVFGTIDLNQSFFTIFKYLEYFLLFIMVRDNLKTMNQAKFFIAVFLLTAVLTVVQTNAFIGGQLEKNIEFFRVAPPVESRHGGEAGILGGYLLFMMAITGGLLIYTRSTPLAVFLICLELGMLRTFLYTLSRGSYLAIIPMLIALVCYTKRGRLALVYIISITIALVLVFMPSMVKERVTKTVSTKTEIMETGDVGFQDESVVLNRLAARGTAGVRLELEESPQLRLESYKRVLFRRFPKSPLFGFGVARFFIDGQIFLTLCEVGLVGFLLFVWTLRRLFKGAKTAYNLEAVKNNNFASGLTLGFLAAFIGMIVHATSSNTFIIIKIMEPFWFIAAIVLSLPQLLENENI